MKTCVGIDAYYLSPPLRGIGVSINSLVQSLPTFSDIHFLVFATDKCTSNFGGDNVTLIKSRHCNPFVWYESVLDKLIRDYPVNSLILTSGLHPIFLDYNVEKIVAFIHDVSYLSLVNNPLSWNIKSNIGRLYRSISFWKIVNSSNLIVTVSESSKLDILRYISYDRRKDLVFHTLYNNFDLSYNCSSTNTTKSKKILLVSGPHPQKNITALFKALDCLPPNLLYGWTVEIIGFNPGKSLSTRLRNHSVRANFVFQGYLDHESTLSRYREAYIFVFTSYKESFGIPLLEALRSNCYIISSNRGASFEVCGNNALYFDPDDYVSLSAYIRLLVENYPSKRIYTSPTAVLNSDYVASLASLMLYFKS